MWVDTLHSFYILTSPAVVRLLCPKKKKNPAILAGKPGMIAGINSVYQYVFTKKLWNKNQKGPVYNMGYQLTRICESLSLVNRFMHTVKKNLIFLSYINQ